MSRSIPPRIDALLPASTLAALLLTLAAIAAPHALRLPIWITVLALTCGVWRYLRAIRGEPLPPAWLRVLLTVAVAVGVYGSYGTLLGREAGTALLVSMTALKLLEMRARRDTHVVLYLGFLLIGMQFLYSQSIPNVVFLLVAVWAMLMLLISTHRATGHGQPWQYARLSGALVLQALPVAVVLFVLFPRIAGPIWKLPEDAHATTGLSEEMSPGSVSELSLSDAVAFRVEFDGPMPPEAQRYWRAIVLSHYDGRSWRRLLPNAPLPRLEGDGEPTGYQVLLEPHGQSWLPALELATAAPDGGRFSPLHELRSTAPVNELRQYSLRSAIDHRLEPALSSIERSAYLALPDDAAPQARAVAREWRSRDADPRELLRQARQFFVERPFVYTLSPPRLPRDPVDQFLFDTRRGFCEHYASAFTVLMRAAGVPTRVVTGYMGGELNPVGDYLIVRQSDAHAWAEVWLENEGWVRVDPTAWVSPARIERGLAAALPHESAVPLLSRRDGGLLKALELRLDALSTGWSRWVLGYGPELQRQFLGGMGLDSVQKTAIALAGAIGLMLAAIAGWLLLQGRRSSRDPVLASYQKFCDKLACVGLARARHEGPADYARRVAAARPDLAERVDVITALYIGARYGRASEPSTTAELRRRVVAFRAGARLSRA